jgi:hypothetical protein
MMAAGRPQLTKTLFVSGFECPNTSGDTSNPAICGRVKTGQLGSGSVRDWVEVYLAASC